jgi:hypothetical protein
MNCEVAQVANNLLNNLVTGLTLMWFRYTFYRFRPTTILIIVKKQPIIAAVWILSNDVNDGTQYNKSLTVLWKHQSVHNTEIYNCSSVNQWRSWLGHCATSRKVAGSIPDGVIGIFHLHNPSGRTMTLGVDSASNRNEYQEPVSPFIFIYSAVGKVEAFMIVTTTIIVPKDVKSCNLIDLYWCFVSICLLHL